MVKLASDTHDAYAAGSQFITHFTGRMLGELNLESTPINTRYCTAMYCCLSFNLLRTTCSYLHPVLVAAVLSSYRGFDTLLELVGNTCEDSFDLFYALYKYNANSRDQLNLLDDAFTKVVRSLNKYGTKESDGLDINPRVADIPPSSTVYLAAKVHDTHLLYNIILRIPLLASANS